MEKFLRKNNSKLRSQVLIALLATVFVLAVFFAMDGDRSNSTNDITSTSSVPKVRIAALLPLTGPLSSFGRGEEEAMRVAIEEHDPESKRVEFIFEDTQGSGEKTALAINRLLASGYQHFVVSTSGSVQTALPRLRDSGKDVIAFTQCMVSDITKGYPFAFRIYATIDEETDILAAYANDKGYKNIAVLRLNAPHGQQGLELFSRKSEKHGIGVSTVETFNMSDRDLSSQLVRISSANPDAVLVYAYPHNFPVIFKQMEQQGFEVPILANSGMTLQQLKEEVSDEFRSRIVFPAPEFFLNPLEPRGQGFVKAMQAKGFQVDWDKAFFYDMTTLLVTSLSDDVIVGNISFEEALRKKMPYSGVSGAIQLNSDRDSHVNLQLVRWKAGKPDLVWRMP